MTDERVLNGSHRKQREAHMRREPRTSVPPTPMTDEQKHRARLTVARGAIAANPDSRARQIVETRLLLDMLGLREAP